MSRPDPSTSREHLTAIGHLLRERAPAGWQRVQADFLQVGPHAELEVVACAGERRARLDVPELATMFDELKTVMYEPGRGAWLQCRYTLDAAGGFEFDFALDAEPRWRERPTDTGELLAKELARFPRDQAHVPGWLRLAAGIPLDTVFRLARVVDAYTEGRPPLVDRPPLADAEVPVVLQYLEREPAVFSGDGLGPDVFAPAEPPSVPERYHTDGTWIWHASVPHYLRKYGTPPEPDLLAHIRAQRFHPPYVDHLTRRTAEAELLGAPRPRPTPADIVPTAGDVAAELEAGPRPGLDEDDVPALLAARLGQHGVWPEAYRLGERADAAWCLNRTTQGWEVAWHDGGVPADPRYFAHAEDASQYLLGALLLHPARMTAGHETPLETVKELGDWPIQPADGEPPLTLLRNKRMVRLVAGTAVLRFGGESGNLVHSAGTRFPMTSLPLERETEEWSYRLRRPLYVITGITVPWANLPGGGVAYVLPKPIAEHLADGSLEGIERG